MLIVVTYLMVFLVVSFPIGKFLNWGFNQDISKQVPYVHSPLAIVCFVADKVIQFFIGYYVLVFLEQFFYYEDPILINFGILIMLLGFCWSFFNGFQFAGSRLFFVLGILTFFNINFLWIFLVLFFVFVLLLNHVEVGLFLALVSNCFLMRVYDLNELFLISNLTILMLFFIKDFTKINNFFSSRPITLL